MPVYKLMDEMPYEELLGWQLYFKSRPIGWREDQRTAVLMKSFVGDKVDPKKIFSSLAAVEESSNKMKSSLRLDSAILPFMLKATGGDQIPL
jgi:hypothetical protein